MTTGMKHGVVRSRVYWALIIHAFLLPCMNCMGNGFPALGNETDRLALIAFRNQISEDPFRVFDSWNDSLHFCNWEGVTCGRRHPQRVAALNLVSSRLVGPISPALANLTFLTSIKLSSNSFHGEIPREIGQLFRLQDLDLSGNGLLGRIPVELSFLSKLMSLNLGSNNLIGNIPAPLGNLSALVSLYLHDNSLEGSIPDELGQLAKLQFLRFPSNKLSGEIPPSLYNLSSIIRLSVTDNRLHGNLPANLGLTLPNLKNIFLGKNAFSGPIPVSLPNSSGLAVVDFYFNNFSGPLPMNLGSLQLLRILNLGVNKLGGGEGTDDWGFLTSLANCSGLEVLSVYSNQLRGTLPTTIVNLSTHLTQLLLGRNPTSGSIPTDISNLFNLNKLDISESFILNTIPNGIGKLPNLEGLYLYGNKLSGQIPSSLGNITGLAILSLYENRFQGSIPSSLGNCRLELVALDRNEFNGTIPIEILSIPTLVSLYIPENHLIGSLPSEVGNLKQLQYLNFAHNKLTGEIPITLSNCPSLEELNLSSNFLQGAILPPLKNLKSIRQIDLSHNNLSGHIPEALEKFPFLQYLDLSSNDLDGEVPNQGIFKNASAFSVLGNNRLCGGIQQLKLPTCSKNASQKHGRRVSRTVIFSVIGVVSCLILSSFFFANLYRARRNDTKKPLHASFLEGQYLNVSYSDLSKATGGFSSDNLIGVGSYGSVYKGFLDCNESLVAVKVLNLQQHGASKSFMAECEALRNIRHRSLVRIITVCSSIDFKGNDFKALVFEYMPNESLEKWLHPNVCEQLGLSLNLVQRLGIAIDVASALEYLHHHCGTPVVHRDLKPSNVLLDDDMCAHVCDFGLARFLSNAAGNIPQDKTSSTGIRGSFGYIPPEYGMGGKASAQGDVYSYGILLLEMFTGKRPTDDMFKDGISLHQFAKMALPDHVMSIVDPRLLSEDVQALNNVEQYDLTMRKMQESLVSVVKIGVACSVQSPNERMEMRDIAVEMHAIRDLYLGVGIY